MNERSELTLEIIQQKYLPYRAGEMQAMIRVTAAVAGDEPAGPPSASGAEVIIVDCSGSMAHPRPKLLAARRAACAALDAMRDGTEFAVLSGRLEATMVYPHRLGLVTATEETRAAAKQAVNRLEADGLTRMSSWLALSARLLRPLAGRIRHAMLFTDGHNWHESEDGSFDRVLAACTGMFTCDARGIGDDWDPSDLRKIAAALHGTADGLADVADLEDEFRSVMLKAMRMVVPDVTLRLRVAQGVAIREFRQLHPADADLTKQGETVAGAATQYWIGSWSGETRDYLVTLSADASRFRQNTDERLARVEVAVRGADGDLAVAGDPEFVLARWTFDPPEPTWLPTDSYTGQRETGRAIVEGCVAWLAAKYEKATEAWAEAVKLAIAAGDDERLSLLATLVEVTNPVTGEVRLHDELTKPVVLQAQVRAEHTSFVSTRGTQQRTDRQLRKPPAWTPKENAARVCPRPGCGRLSPADARSCEKCGQPFGLADSGSTVEAGQ
ncbi:MAG TPA: hypothetical protein VN714_30580 [Trebonia sp.]|nr:hypothetical protein [Trebonia sp.]